MTVPADAVVDARLARLDSPACRALVADVWAARGFETHTDRDVVVATRRGESLVILPLAGGRLRSATLPDRPVDVVVAFDDRAARTARATADARVLTRADFREMLRYALTPADADALSRRHLGGLRTELRPPLRLRALAAVEQFQQRSHPLAVVAVTALVVIAVAAAGGAVGPAAESSAASDRLFAGAPADGGETDEQGDGPSGSAPSSRSRTGSVGSEDVESRTLAPGVSPEGITNLTALAVAHDRALGTQSYTLWIDSLRPFTAGPDGPRTKRDTDIAVEGDRYLVTETLEHPDNRRLVRVVYFDGTDWYVDDRSIDEANVWRVDGTANDVSVPPDPRVLRRTLVRKYLATPTTDVTEQIDVGGETRYRIEGHGRPPGFSSDEVSNYSVVAFVDESGLVHGATIDLTVVTAEGINRLRFEWTYGEFDATTVTSPAWIDQADESPASRGAPNGTVPTAATA